jgi:multidrug efflux pump subunit AcrB
VGTPIEQEVNGVDDMLYITSQSTGDGRVSIDVVFKAGVNVDQAQVFVQNRVAIAEPRLPEGRHGQKSLARSRQSAIHTCRLQRFPCRA